MTFVALSILQISISSKMTKSFRYRSRIIETISNVDTDDPVKLSGLAISRYESFKKRSI